jgi:hypothetical protein
MEPALSVIGFHLLVDLVQLRTEARESFSLALLADPGPHDQTDAPYNPQDYHHHRQDEVSFACAFDPPGQPARVQRHLQPQSPGGDATGRGR